MMIRAKIAQLAKLAAASAVSMACTLPARADSGWGLLNMTPGVTEISRQIYGLHMEIFWICVIIAAIVFGAMIFSIVTYRKSKGAVADVTIVHNTTVELIWTAVPVAILVFMAIPAAKTPRCDRGHHEDRSQHQGHRLPVGLAVRLPRQRCGVLLAPRP